MRNGVVWPAAILTVLAVLTASVVAQPPDRRPPRGPGSPRGPGGGPLERVVDDLNLSEGKRDTAFAAIRGYQDNVGRMTDVSSASLLLKMKEVLSEDEYKKLQEATDKVRVRPGGSRSLNVDDVVERIMSFDKNKDGKVTKDELPERMQYLLDKGDANKDGALDKEEIKTLAGTLAKEGTFLGTGPGNRGGPGAGLSLRMIERAIDDLKLSEGKKESATAAVQKHKEDARKLTELVRAELVLQMGDLLSGSDFDKFKTALDRQPGVGDRPGGPPPGGRNGPPGGGPPGRDRPPRP